VLFVGMPASRLYFVRRTARLEGFLDLKENNSGRRPGLTAVGAATRRFDPE
jgi:hypothetical protein